jgi:hypothetical protein
MFLFSWFRGLSKVTKEPGFLKLFSLDAFSDQGTIATFMAIEGN